MEVKLEPCPFCGGKAYLYGGYGSGIYIACLDCDCKVGFVNSEDGDDGGIFNNKEDAIKAWNTRPHPQREALDEEKLTKLAYSVNKIFTEREEIPVAMRKFIDLIVKNFATPSLEDLLSALPEKESEDAGPMDGRCDPVERRGFNRGRNVCIAALKGLWK